MSSLSLPPQPRPDPDSEDFWRATEAGRIELCRCRQCGLWHHPPLERCRDCAGETHFEPIQGTGQLHSYIVVRHAAVPGYLDELPYVIGLVELDDQPGLRVVGQLPEVDPAAIEPGSRVQAGIGVLPPGDFHVIHFRITD